jgi:hypothetical protein
MTRQASFNLIFNAVGALIGVIVVGYVVYALLHAETEPPCSTRYPAPTRYSLHTADGALLSPIELQARVGFDEWGVIGNAKVVEAAEAPAGAALEVTLATVPDTAGTGRHANGVAFRWSPTGVRAATAACLAYDLWLPDDFDFAAGGLLPGIFGAAPAAAAGDPAAATGFTARLQWRAGGEGALEVAGAGGRFRSVAAPRFELPKGRWTRVEQELVLSTPGAEDGVVRLWLDGALKAETTQALLRKDESVGIAGVLADIGYVREPAKPGTLRLGPFELAWK